MKTIDTFYETIINNWGINCKGRGAVNCVKPLQYTKLIVAVLKRMLIKNPDLKVFICVDGYDTRKSISSELENEKIDQSYITILSESYINVRYNYKYDLVIFVGLDKVSDKCEALNINSRFHLFIINNTIIKAEDLKRIYTVYKPINEQLGAAELNNINLSSPVEERRIGCSLSDEDKVEYDKYTDFITQVFNIFGDFDAIAKARIGDSVNNISASEFRTNLAIQNGWSAELDMTIGFNRQVDDCYNPNALLDKANNCYQTMLLRNNLVTDNNVKLEVILDIVKEHNDKKIIIISKRGEFAAKLTEYLVDNGVSAGDYHDAIEPKILVDEDGIPILIKSGAHKGEPKIIKSKAISTANERYFDCGRLNVLSIKNASCSDLEASADIWIITSPLCDSVQELKHRYNKVVFNSVPNLIYKVFLSGTHEETKLLSGKPNKFTSISTKYINNNLDENNCGITCS